MCVCCRLIGGLTPRESIMNWEALQMLDLLLWQHWKIDVHKERIALLLRCRLYALILRKTMSFR
jgi:hypothetical protein